MKNCTLLKGKNLAFVMFFLFFALGGIAQTGKTSKSDMRVIARHYPDPNESGCPYVKIIWGTDLDEDTFDFETGIIPSYWDNDKTYPWVICDSMIYNGSYCIKSGNGGVAGSTSSISAVVDYVRTGTIRFAGGCWGEGSGMNIFDKCEFYIDGERIFSLGEVQSWNTYSFDVTAGTHTFTWSYTKDGSVNPTGDAFFVDNVEFDGVQNSKAFQDYYNVYRTPCAQTGGPTSDNRVLIAEDIMATSAIDTTWIGLENGDYQYVVKKLYTTTALEEWSSNCITKTPIAEFSVTATPKPAAGGTVTGAGSFYFGDTCTLNARPSKYYYFYGWMQDTVPISWNNPYAFAVNKNTDLIANFRKEEFYYYAYAEPYQYGSAEAAGGDGGNICVGDTIRLSATPNQGYHFVRWTATGNESRNTVEITTNPTYTFVLDSDLLDSLFVDVYSGNMITFDAYFDDAVNYPVTAIAQPEIGGSVSGSGTYAMGDSCTLVATPAYGYHFLNWEYNGDEVSDSTTYQFIVMDTALYIAHFEPNNYLVTATTNPVEGGTVTGAGTYAYGDTCTLVATANTGYTFLAWRLYGDTYDTIPTIKFEVIDSLAYEAVFELNSYAITVAAVPEEGGTVTGAGTYNHGENCTLTANPAYGYHFLNWEYNGDEVSDSTTYTFSVIDSGLYVANFERNNYLVTATADPVEGGTVTGAGTYAYGDTCTLVATANTGYTFLAWMLYGDEYDTNPTITFEVVDSLAYQAVFELNSYDIAASANPTIGGTVTGDTTYYHGATCTLTATEAEGYTFVNWTENNQEVSTSLVYSFTVTGPRTLVANFSLNSYPVTATAVPEEGGTITGAGSYNHGETCTLTATANTGYNFISWTLYGDTYDTIPTIQIQVVDTLVFVANFELINYNITAMVTVNPTEGGTVNGAGNYNYGETCTLTAVPATGYHFVNWTKNGQEVSTELTYTFLVTEAAEYAANFEINSYDIAASANPTIGGTVAGDSTYTHGATCTLTATEEEGYTFVNWTENNQEVSTSLVYTFTVTGPRTLVANFSLNSYPVTATAVPEEGGTITGAGSYNHGETCTLTATANTGYNFISWTLYGDTYDTIPTIQIQVVDTLVFVANFELINYNITAMVTVNPTEGGTVNGAGNYNYGETCTLTAVPATGYHFVNWTKNGQEVSTELTYTFLVTEAAEYAANFEINSYDVTAMLTVNPTEGGTVTGAGTFTYGQTCTLTAVPATGYHFVNWTKNGEEISTDTTYSFTVTEEAAYAANFEINSYELTASANPTAGGTVTGAGTYNHFESCTMTATQGEGYTFVNWTENGEEVATTLVYTFTVTGPRTLVANFSLNSYDIAASANPTVGGTIDGAGTYNHFEECTLTATEGEGYTFVNWTENGEEIATSLEYTFTVTGPRTLVANFSLNSYDITVSGTPTNGGSVTGGGTFNHFETCTLTATPAEGYHFVKWTLDGTEVSTSETYSFTVTGPGDYVAHFQRNKYLITVTHTTGGSTTGGGNYNHFAICTLHANPSTGYHFVNWTENGDEVSTDATYVFTVTGPRTLVANFEQNIYTITATANPSTGGTVTGAGDFTHGEICTLTATPNEGFYFVEWTKGSDVISTDMAISFEVTETATYRAHFERYIYSITAEANPEEGGTITGTGDSFQYNTTCQLVAHVNTGYHFVNWTLNGTEVTTNTTYSFVVTESAHYVANFEIDTFEITVSADPEEGGVVTGGGTYAYGEEVVLMAEANPDYLFVYWTEGDEVVSEDERVVFNADSDRQLVAHFTSTVGVGEHDATTFAIYPNPVMHQLTIEASDAINMLEIYTITGALVSKQSNCSNKVEVNVESFVPGTYMIRLTTDKTIEIRKFIKE